MKIHRREKQLKAVKNTFHCFFHALEEQHDLTAAEMISILSDEISTICKPIMRDERAESEEAEAEKVSADRREPNGS